MGSININVFGNFRFNDVPPGGRYVITVMHERYLFENTSQVISVADDVGDVSFLGYRP